MKQGMMLIAVSMVFGCSMGVDTTQDERVGQTSEAMTTPPKPSETLMCTDCFEETNGGGPGTPSGLGSNGFTGGVIGWANGATDRAAPEGGCKNNPDPDVECVEVHGTQRPLDDSNIRILIVGRDKGQEVIVDVPKGRGLPTRVSSPNDSPKGAHIECPVVGVACAAECAMVGAKCNTVSLYHGGNGGNGYGLLTSCSTAGPTYACTFRFMNGELCSQPFMYGQKIGPNFCTTKDGKSTSTGW